MLLVKHLIDVPYVRHHFGFCWCLEIPSILKLKTWLVVVKTAFRLSEHRFEYTEYKSTAYNHLTIACPVCETPWGSTIVQLSINQLLDDCSATA